MTDPVILDTAAQLSVYNTAKTSARTAIATGLPRGPSTGFRSLDVVVGGFCNPGIYVVHGAPGAGKTAFVAQVSAHSGFPALFLTTEMTPLEMIRRHLAREIVIPKNRLLAGDSEADDLVGSALGHEHLPPWFLIDGCEAEVSLAFLRDALVVLKDQYNSASAVLVVDSLQSWTMLNYPADMSEYEMLNTALQDLRSLAANEHVVVWLVSERNRQAMRTGGISAAAGTRRVEYSADLMLDMSEDRSSHADSIVSPGATKTVKLGIVKNRFGGAGFDLVMVFNGDTMTFKAVDVV